MLEESGACPIPGCQLRLGCTSYVGSHKSYQQTDKGQKIQRVSGVAELNPRYLIVGDLMCSRPPRQGAEGQQT